MCLHFLFKSVFHKLRHKFLSGFVNSFPDYVVPFTHTFADHSSVITKCWGFELQNGKSSLKSPQTLAAQGFAPASFSSMNDKKHRKLRFSMLFCCKNAANVVGQGVGQTLTHTLTHTRKCPDGFEEYRRGSFCLLSGISHPFSAYITCAMKLPIVCAASSCFCLVAWV